MMSVFIIEIFICIGFIILCYNCCVKGARARGLDGQDGPLDNHEDLRRFRERMSERGGEGDSGDPVAQDDNGTSVIVARKEIIEKNLFSRRIHREESVKELSQLLAISRGGVVDEELGECAPASDADPNPTSNFIKPDMTASLSESSLPTASAPPSTAAAAATTDMIATAISSPPDPPSFIAPPKNPLTLEPAIRNLWSNLTHNLQGSERDNAAAPTSNTPCQTNAFTISNTAHVHKLECSVCLNQYSPNETIAWAKDGGDPPTLSSASVSINNDMGCDHIFHKECIVAWLQDHDECPLCRRKVVHMDADVRFAGWEMG
mmetsp:Transcript_25819/g.47483  ORF Transcript_25819/g.47483 Transcript_25819/m.47483 type:complete len:319 (-) Transcript_25819:156-1112(-)